MTLLTELEMESKKTVLTQGMPVENRVLTPLSGPEFERIKQAALPGTAIQTLGQELIPEKSLALCEAPEGSSLCAAGVHKCNGILQRLLTQFGDVCIITCRGVEKDAPVDSSLATYALESPKERAEGEMLYSGTLEAVDPYIKLALQFDKREFYKAFTALPKRSQDIIKAATKSNLAAAAVVAYRAQEIYENAGGNDGLTREAAGASLLRYYAAEKKFQILVSKEKKGGLDGGRFGNFDSKAISALKGKFGWYSLDDATRAVIRNLNSDFADMPDVRPDSSSSLNEDSIEEESVVTSEDEQEPSVLPVPNNVGLEFEEVELYRQYLLDVTSGILQNERNTPNNDKTAVSFPVGDAKYQFPPVGCNPNNPADWLYWNESARSWNMQVTNLAFDSAPPIWLTGIEIIAGVLELGSATEYKG
ncbi:hypothetical protein [Streptomyces sp. NPDC126514]|uniref:hypothetical protein n=1 Tax=Streptomyces sp. NPDC126514 TaxID=3155210 RepID=UPI003328CB70